MNYLKAPSCYQLRQNYWRPPQSHEPHRSYARFPLRKTRSWQDFPYLWMNSSSKYRNYQRTNKTS